MHLKGVLIIYIGFYYNFSLEIIAIGGLLGIIGHLFPFWLKFKGGKGIATFIGVALTLNPLLFGILAVCFVMFTCNIEKCNFKYVFRFYCLRYFMLGNSCFFDLWPLSIAILFILFRHRFDLLESWNKRWWKKQHVIIIHIIIIFIFEYA